MSRSGSEARGPSGALGMRSRSDAEGNLKPPLPGCVPQNDQHVVVIDHRYLYPLPCGRCGGCRGKAWAIIQLFPR